MSQKRNNPRFRKSVDWDSVNNPKTSNRALNSPNVNADKILERRINAKIELMNRYNMSEEEAEVTLKRLERKTREERKKENNANVKRFIEEDNDDVIIPIHVQNNKKEALEKHLAKPTLKNKEVVIEEVLEQVPVSQNEDQKQMDETFKIKNDLTDSDKTILKNQIKKPKQDVDSILSDLIPDYQRELSIEVKNVSLSFEVGNDKIDNLKEFILKL